MRNFFQSHWKVIIAILLAIVLATLTVDTSSATPPLASRLQAHVHVLASATPRDTLHHIETSLTRYGYSPHVNRGHGIEAAMVHAAPGAPAGRIFIIGAHIGAHADADAGIAAVLELARAARRQPLAPGTEIRFVFFMDDPDRIAIAGRRGAGSFMAYVGTRASSDRVRQAMASLRSDPLLAHHGLMAQAHVMGLTLSGHGGQAGGPALVLTDTGLLRFPYFRAATPSRDGNDYDGMARVVSGLSRTLGALAGAVEA